MNKPPIIGIFFSDTYYICCGIIERISILAHDFLAVSIVPVHTSSETHRQNDQRTIGFLTGRNRSRGVQ